VFKFFVFLRMTSEILIGEGSFAQLSACVCVCVCVDCVCVCVRKWNGVPLVTIFCVAELLISRVRALANCKSECCVCERRGESEVNRFFFVCVCVCVCVCV